jgi:hypothetical protein
MTARQMAVRLTALSALAISILGCEQKEGDFFITGVDGGTGFSVIVQSGFDHPSGQQSFVCARVSTNPAQPNANFEAEVSGPAVDGDGRITGSLDGNGTRRFQVLIQNTGTYTVEVTVTSNGHVEESESQINVTGSGGSCP